MSEENIPVSEINQVTIWVLADNYYDSLRPDSEIAKRHRVVPGTSIHAEHGLSYFIETRSNGSTGICMFDFGLDPYGVMNNINLLGLDLKSVDAFALSHGHFDHWTGAEEILRNHGKINGDTPFYVGEEAFSRRCSLRPGTAELIDLGQLRKERLEALGVKVREISRPVEIIPGAYSTGNIRRATDYEKPSPSLLVMHGDKPEPDDFREEQALFFNVKGKGLVVLSGCAHAGIVNTIRHAQDVSGITKIYAVIGGFHLIHAQPEIIHRTISDILDLRPAYIVPAHCTGFEALVAFSQAMPDEFVLSTAGTRYVFTN
jgi:7,8-dihydropterin-6-yl-methyl-4-(beta-D-ribofuranosyl)aminobenzene 5'-phosphate synthase